MSFSNIYKTPKKVLLSVLFLLAILFKNYWILRTFGFNDEPYYYIQNLELYKINLYNISYYPTFSHILFKLCNSLFLIRWIIILIDLFSLFVMVYFVSKYFNLKWDNIFLLFVSLMIIDWFRNASVVITPNYITINKICFQFTIGFFFASIRNKSYLWLIGILLTIMILIQPPLLFTFFIVMTMFFFYNKTNISHVLFLLVSSSLTIMIFIYLFKNQTIYEFLNEIKRTIDFTKTNNSPYSQGGIVHFLLINIGISVVSILQMLIVLITFGLVGYFQKRYFKKNLIFFSKCVILIIFIITYLDKDETGTKFYFLSLIPLLALNFNLFSKGFERIKFFDINALIAVILLLLPTLMTIGNAISIEGRGAEFLMPFILFSLAYSIKSDCFEIQWVILFVILFLLKSFFIYRNQSISWYGHGPKKCSTNFTKKIKNISFSTKIENEMFLDIKRLDSFTIDGFTSIYNNPDAFGLILLSGGKLLFNTYEIYPNHFYKNQFHLIPKLDKLSQLIYIRINKNDLQTYQTDMFVRSNFSFVDSIKIMGNRKGTVYKLNYQYGKR